jgi:outer membrane protein TolC
MLDVSGMLRPPSAWSRSLPAALVGLCACRGAEAWERSADEEVYAILQERRAELGARDAFTIEPPRDTLRERLQESPQGPLVLDLVGCLRVAAENSRQWQEEREALYRAALDLTLERWNYSVQETGTLGAFLAGTGRRGEAEGFLSNLNLFKILGVGTTIVGDIGIDLLRDVGQGDGWDAVSHLSLNITQPLLRGFGPDIVLEPLTQGERDVLYQARSYERFRRTFAVDVAQSFFQVLERVDRLRNEEANYANLVKLRERNEALAEAGRLTDIQVDQARQDELSAQDRLVAARRVLQGALDDFKFQLGLPIETDLTLEEGGLRSLEAWQELVPELTEELVIRTGLERRLDHRTVLDRQADAERSAHVAADALRMGADLTAAGSAASDEGQPASFEDDRFVWRLGLDVDLPIGRIPERNAYKSALIALQASQRDAQESADRITSELRDSLRSLEAARASYAIQSGSVVLAERRVESAVLNLEAGRADTRDVLEAQESLLQAQNDLAAALTDTILAGLFLHRDMELIEVSDEGIRIVTVGPSEPARTEP